MSELGDLLRELRGKRSLREIADLTELSHTYISDVEKGYRRGTKKPLNPSPETLKRLAKAYDYPYEELMKAAGYVENTGYLNKNQESYHKVEVNGKIISLSQEEYEVLEAIKKYPVAMDNLKSNPEKKVKQMITSWRKVEEAMKEIDDDDDGDYLE
ncbi:helix-turn-helix domain-containing protein [Lysinibacillus sp. NPDC047702]|uniref:helix-turn-helix domain-containing protein n=1 Tax=unclassified Lysinibacillus TaxID=2636778 RepID=UPI003D0442C7